MALPRITIAGLRGGSGKTILSVGLIAAWKAAGESVVPFKKGPDYIDAGWLAQAAGCPCSNLDTFLVDPADTVSLFLRRARPESLCVIEGNRGLFDSMDPEGSTSTAELAKLLVSPVVMVVDCTKTTRTMAAMLLGLAHFDPQVDVRGVVLNRVANPRHEDKLRVNIERHCGIPVLGAFPSFSLEDFPERHMGLVPTPEHPAAVESIARMAGLVKSHVDLDRMAEIARSPLVPEPCPCAGFRRQPVPPPCPPPAAAPPGPPGPVVGVVRDSAFQFYYPENIEALAEAGARVREVSLLSGESLSGLDALYIGGGFPETHAQALSGNPVVTGELKALVEAGLPVYAECGGLMVLGLELVENGRSWPMSGVLPIRFGLSKKPKGHGYTVCTVDTENPYFPLGTILRGHEFHYSYPLEILGEPASFAFSVSRSKGLIRGRDGILHKNVLATYTHIHALGTPQWAPALVAAARRYGGDRKR